MRALECVQLSLPDARLLPGIPSGYETDRVLRLHRSGGTERLVWTLRDHILDRPFVKQYDDGRLDEWLKTYADAGSPEELEFLAAYDEDRYVGLLTWRLMEWNTSVWLVDIRTRRENRRQGVGSWLVTWLKQETRRLGARGIAVETQTSNFPALSFYRSQAFEIVGFNDHLYRNDDTVTGEVATYLFWEAL